MLSAPIRLPVRGQWPTVNNRCGKVIVILPGAFVQKDGGIFSEKVVIRGAVCFFYGFQALQGAMPVRFAAGSGHRLSRRSFSRRFEHPDAALLSYRVRLDP